MDKFLDEVLKWLCTVVILGSITILGLLLYSVLTTYPNESLIGLFILFIVASCRYAFFE